MSNIDVEMIRYFAEAYHVDDSDIRELFEECRDEESVIGYLNEQDKTTNFKESKPRTSHVQRKQEPVVEIKKPEESKQIVEEEKPE